MYAAATLGHPGSARSALWRQALVACWIYSVESAWVTYSDLQGELTLDDMEEVTSSSAETATSALERLLREHLGPSQLSGLDSDVEQKLLSQHGLTKLGLEVLEHAVSSSGNPNMPREPMTPEQEQEVVKSSKNSGMNILEMIHKAGKWVRKFRAGNGNLVATLVASTGDPSLTCIVKLFYILYRFEDEDDYPYLPRCLSESYGTTGPTDDSSGLDLFR
eukprot:TRINITY_DN31135_c0_g1_i2.p1 TRINITY_DN31135_c0_g1~~TRINITY_DN31135_c0_g1_i2.p1  ORF type:complete len:219 (+),score=33.71 TRINITY_DN31135_c0_g1_i2:40-696(+)